MKRMVPTLVALALLALGVVFPAFSWQPGAPGPVDEPTRITRYVADFTVGEDGDLEAVETITVDFPDWPEKHGIFRFFDHADANAPWLRRRPTDISVEMDGRPVDVVLLEEGEGRYTVARIGSEYATVSPGLHTYTIRYAIADVLLPDQGGRSRFYWDLVPGGWQQEIESASLRVHLPAATSQVRCAVGWDATSGCTATGEGTTTLTVAAGALEPRTPVTLSATVAAPAPEPEGALPWSPRWDRVLGDSVPTLLGVLALAALAALAGLKAARGAHEPTPPFPVLHAPPPGVGPSAGQYVLTEQLDRTAFVASLMHAAELGAVTLERPQEGWVVTDRKDQAAWARLDPVTRRTLELLHVRDKPFTARSGNVKSGRVLGSALTGFESATRKWAREEGHLVPTGFGSGGGLVVAGAAGVAVVALFAEMSVLALVPGLFAAFAAPVATPGAGTRRTAKGRALWSQLGGFRRMLETPSSQQRFDFSGREELYTAYLPWAVAFGVADRWAAKYRTEVGTEPPAPAYLRDRSGQAYRGPHTVDQVDRMVHDFRRVVSSSIASYEASQRPKSSGSRGGRGRSFSGGGGRSFGGGRGGGGGGGGSW